MARLPLIAKYCDGYVLTGGRSSRMGRDKALLELDGRTLIEVVAAHVKRALGEVTLIGNRDKYSPLGLPVIDDLHPGQGPLAGIETALRHSRKPLVLVVACDMPFLNAPFLDALVQIASVADAEVTVAESVDYAFESLCAVYNQSTLPFVEAALERGELKVTSLYEKVRVRKLSAEECRPYNPHGVLFSNINTPQDFELARRRFESNAAAAAR